MPARQESEAWLGGRWNGNWNAKHLEAGGKALQPFLSISCISDVIRKRPGGAEADADVQRVSVPLVVTDESIVGSFAAVVRGGDGLLEIGIGERDDVSGPASQRGKIHAAFEVGPQPAVRVGFYRQQERSLIVKH